MVPHGFAETARGEGGGGVGGGEGGCVDDKLVHFVPLRECRWCLG